MEVAPPAGVLGADRIDLSPIDRGKGTLVRRPMAALPPHRFGRRSPGEKVLAQTADHREPREQGQGASTLVSCPEWREDKECSGLSFPEGACPCICLALKRLRQSTSYATNLFF